MRRTAAPERGGEATLGPPGGQLLLTTLEGPSFRAGLRQAGADSKTKVTGEGNQHNLDTDQHGTGVRASVGFSELADTLTQSSWLFLR